jgi:hypothetical protein
MQLAQQMQQRPVYEGRGARGMGGAFGNGRNGGGVGGNSPGRGQYGRY